MKLLQKIAQTDLFNTLKHSAVFFSSNVATQAVTFLLMPFLTRMLTDAEFGYIELFKSYMFLGATFFSLNSYTSVSRYYFEKKNDFAEFTGTTFLLSLIIFAVFSVLIIPNSQFVANLLDVPETFPLLILIASFFMVILRIYQQVVIPKRRSKDDLLVSVVRAINILILTIVLVTLLDTEKYLGYIYAVLIAGIVISALIYYKIRNDFKISFKFSHIKYIINYSLPLMPYHISAILLSHFSRMMINSYDGAGAAGIYSAAANIGMLVSVINLATNRAIIPDFFKFYDNKEYKRLDQLMRKIFSLVALASLFLMFFAEEILLIMASSKFEAALPVIPIVVFTYVFDSIYQIYSRYIIHSKKTLYLSAALILTATITIILNIYLIPKFGFIGGAYSNLIAYFFLSIIIIIITGSILKYRITPFSILLKPLILLIIFSSVIYFIPDNINNIVLFAAKIVLLIAFVYYTLKNEIGKLFL
jgi:O-antigen/teichoic acid export membrane protein